MSPTHQFQKEYFKKGFSLSLANRTSSSNTCAKKTKIEKLLVMEASISSESQKDMLIADTMRSVL